jgi:FkbM family methyltransferase
MPLSRRLARLGWIARWKLASLVNRGRFREFRVNGYAIHLNISESLMMYQIARGEYEFRKIEVLQRMLAPGGGFVDVGANMGVFAFYAATRLGEGGRVVAVEPEPTNCRWIRAGIESNGFTQVTLLEGALSDREGQSTLHLAEKSGWHTLNPGQRKRGHGELRVPVWTLDTVTAGLERLECVKIDVEGHEHAVLAGARETIRRFRPTILLDWHPQLGADAATLEAMLREWGYGTAYLNDPGIYMDRLPGAPAELLLEPD